MAMHMHLILKLFSLYEMKKLSSLSQSKFRNITVLPTIPSLFLMFLTHPPSLSLFIFLHRHTFIPQSQV